MSEQEGWMVRSRRIRQRRWVVAGGLVALGALGATAAGAVSGLDITPSSGPPGTSYTVKVTCDVTPSIYRANMQGDPEQGTIAPRPPDEVSEVSPSVWAVDATAGAYDANWYASCSDTPVGEQRFDTKAPHLWFGPHLHPFGLPSDHTLLEGTDCPPGSTVTGQIRHDEDIVVPFTATIDQFGDWSTPLPGPLGTQELEADASCGSVTYDRLTVTTTSTSTPAPPPTTPPNTVPATVPPGTAPAATPQPASADFTG